MGNILFRTHRQHVLVKPKLNSRPEKFLYAKSVMQKAVVLVKCVWLRSRFF